MQALDQHTLNALARDEVARADAELNRVYSRLRSVLGAKPAALAALKKAQVAWIAFRSSEAEAVALAFDGGSAQPQLQAGTMAALTQERVASLLLLLAGPSVLGDGKDLKDADTLLNRLWKDALVEGGSSDAAKRRTTQVNAQRLWLEFRDAEVALWKVLGGSTTAATARLTWERCRHLDG